jgi:hypothetical protein
MNGPKESGFSLDPAFPGTHEKSANANGGGPSALAEREKQVAKIAAKNRVLMEGATPLPSVWQSSCHSGLAQSRVKLLLPSTPNCNLHASFIAEAAN